MPLDFSDKKNLIDETTWIPQTATKASKIPTNNFFWGGSSSQNYKNGSRLDEKNNKKYIVVTLKKITLFHFYPTIKETAG